MQTTILRAIMIDTNSETWLEIERHIDAQLAASSRKLASVTVDHNLTMYHRGIVAGLTEIKLLVNKESVALLQSNNYS
jgi:hypothetical protein